MANDINITLSEVSNHAQVIRSCNTQLFDLLSNAQASVRTLAGGAWQGDAANAIEVEIGDLMPKMTNYRDVIDAYAKFLDNTVKAYNETEAQVRGNASQLI